MGKGFAKQMKQMKQMQQQMSQFQKTLDETEMTGSAGNGLVEVTLKGNLEIMSLKIKPECVDPEDIEGLEDLIKEAYKKAFEKVQSEMPSMGGPGGLPFG